MGCRRVASPEELIRVSLDRSTDNLVVGRTFPGRGAWLCARSPDCLAEAVRRRAFDRALRVSCSSDQLAALAERLNG